MWWCGWTSVQAGSALPTKALKSSKSQDVSGWGMCEVRRGTNRKKIVFYSAWNAYKRRAVPLEVDDQCWLVICKPRWTLLERQKVGDYTWAELVTLILRRATLYFVALKDEWGRGGEKSGIGFGLLTVLCGLGPDGEILSSCALIYHSG